MPVMTDEAHTELPPIGPGPVGPGSFRDRKDDGLFGPGSVTWRVYADPAAPLGLMAAVLMQALNPNMMRLFDAVSGNRSDPQGRATRTSQYILTTVFGDSAHAQAAGAMVRRMHTHATWTDPTTGEALTANNPAWLAWTHNTLVWGVLQSCDAYGPKLAPPEQDRLIAEQFRSAELIGLDPATLPATRAALGRYIDEQKSWLAMTLPAAEATTALRRPKLWGNPLKLIPALIVQDGILALLPDWGRKLYGIDVRAMRLRIAQTLTRGMLAAARRSKSYDQVLRATQAEAHPYARTKERPSR
jgi:uncharacterized protein (DUF2236 family)